MWLPFWTVNNRHDLLPSTIQEKCREQHTPLYIAFIDLTKSFALVSGDGLIKVLPKIGCPPKLQSMIESFHTDTKGTVQFNGSEPLKIRSGAKQGCVLTPTLQRSLAFSLACCLNIHSTQQKESTFVPDQMAGSSTSPVSEPRQRYARLLSVTCCLLMTQQLWPTLRRNSSHWWTAPHRPVRTSD